MIQNQNDPELGTKRPMIEAARDKTTQDGNDRGQKRLMPKQLGPKRHRTETSQYRETTLDRTNTERNSPRQPKTT